MPARSDDPSDPSSQRSRRCADWEAPSFSFMAAVPRSTPRWPGASLATLRVDGMRVTDAATLEVSEAVLCGTVNKRIVRAAISLGIRPTGISGQDGNTLVAQRADGSERRRPRLRRPDRIDRSTPHSDASRRRLLTVVAPLAVAADGSHAYNVNADLAAAAIAAALGARAFLAITNVPRVLRLPRGSNLRDRTVHARRSAALCRQRRVSFEHEAQAPAAASAARAAPRWRTSARRNRTRSLRPSPGTLP